MKQEIANDDDCLDKSHKKFTITSSAASVQAPEKDTENEENEAARCSISNEKASPGKCYNTVDKCIGHDDKNVETLADRGI